MNQVLETIERRRSVRKYSDKPIDSKEKETILHACLRAPTAGNMMLYSIIEINDQALKDRLAVTCDNQPFIATAPWVLLFLADYQRWWDYYQVCKVKAYCEKKGLAYRTPSSGDMMLAVCDALIAAQTAVLAAESLGIGSCYIGDILENYEEHRDLMQLPQYVLPITMLCFGYPASTAEAPRKTSRFERDFIVFQDEYKRLADKDFKRMFGPTEESYATSGWFKDGEKNIGQHNYQRKFIANFSIEMTRSVKAMFKNWS